MVHPLGKESVASGDLVVVANWHTVLSRPHDFIRYLTTLKGKNPPDTAWYAPASALPSTVALLAYAGFDLFDLRAVDLETARGSFCLAEGVSRGTLPGPKPAPVRDAPAAISDATTGWRWNGSWPSPGGSSPNRGSVTWSRRGAGQIPTRSLS